MVGVRIRAAARERDIQLEPRVAHRFEVPAGLARPCRTQSDAGDALAELSP